MSTAQALVALFLILDTIFVFVGAVRNRAITTEQATYLVGWNTAINFAIVALLASEGFW